jgi:hypothetical protein
VRQQETRRRQIVTRLALLEAEIPGWPDDPDQLAAIARAARREISE